MPRRNHGSSRQIKVSKEVIRAARLVAERYPDEYAAVVATKVTSARRITGKQWRQLTKLA